jgi:nicotinamidase-related amidase
MIEISGHRVPTELREMIQLDSTALLIIDMQNDWCSPGGSSARAGADMSMFPDVIGRIRRFADACRRVGVPVVNVRMVALEDGKSEAPAWIRLRLRVNRRYDPRNERPIDFVERGSWGEEFVPELQPKPADHVVTKLRSSAFHATELDLTLRAHGIKSAIVTGTTTEGCVESTVRDLSSRDYYPIVLADCVASDVRELHDASLLVMGAYRAELATSGEVLEIWDQEVSR